MALSAQDSDEKSRHNDSKLDMGLEPKPSHQRIGEDVAHLADFDGTVYDGDVGQLAAMHDQSHELGFDDITDFLEKVDYRRSERENISRGSEKASIIVEESNSDIETIENILIDSQNSDKVKKGFKDVANELYSRGNMLEIVTAGVGVAAENILNGSQAAVTGAELEDEGGKMEVNYCGREEKPYRISESMEEVGRYTPIAVGDSPTDADFMQESVEAGGQSIAIEPGAAPYASVDASTDENYESVGVLQLIFDELYSTGSMEMAEERADEFLQNKDYNLSEVEPGENWNAMTLKALSVYEEVK